ncbi:MAG: hypothetical protein ACJAU9_000222 [Lentimonas sp.]|jgi:hypothetical protein
MKVILIISISLLLLIVAAVSDPFSIPFQDWDQIQEEQKKEYLSKSARCTQLKYVSGIGILIGTCMSLNTFIKKRRKSEKEALESR